MIQRLKEIYEEVGKLTENDEDPSDWVGFIHPDTHAEFRHPSSEARVHGTKVVLSGLELRSNKLVERNSVVLIEREMILDEGEEE